MTFNSVLGILLIAHLGLIGVVIALRQKMPRYQGVLMVVGLATLAVATLLLPAELPISSLVITHVALIGFVGAMGALIIQDTTSRRPILNLQRVWVVLSIVWAVVFLGAVFGSNINFVGWRMWGDTAPSLGTWAGFGGLFIMGVLLISVCAYTFYIAPMPEVANRSAFWLTVANGALGASILLMSGTNILTDVGCLLSFASLGGAILACYRHRLIDLRETFLSSIQTIAFTGVAWSVLFGTLYLINRIEIEKSEAGTIGLGLLALLVALMLVPARQIIRWVFTTFVRTTAPNLALATAEYSRSVALAPNLEEVVNATNSTLCNVMNVKRSALILINTTWRKQDVVELIVLESGSTIDKPTRNGFLSKKSPIYQSLAVEKVPLGLFDMEYGMTYQSVVKEERVFFGSLAMQVFVPIVADGRLIGLLACGRKTDDSPYTRRDMELLGVIGQQVGNALRNARLIDDLYHLNNSMRELNKRLGNAKVELEKMDNIKTDFVTIASHELRTPLAQIRGYTDILDSLNDSDTLQKGQATQLVQNLRKSTERMEELIGAMLDVSQLDVNSMDLRFIRTTPEIVVRLAIEPLKEAFEQRNQTLQRIGLTGLPHIQADMQRLVQAFRNIIINAIKYTPDGGNIEVSARLETASKEGDKERILFAFKDNGIGIQAKDKELIFQKFYRGFDTQLHSTGLTKFLGAGPGLGLTIAKGIIEGHGGEIWVESPGQDMAKFPGSTIFVRIPILPTEGQRVALPYDEVPDDRRKTSPFPLFTPEQAGATTQTPAQSDEDKGTKTPTPDEDKGTKTPTPDEDEDE